MKEFFENLKEIRKSKKISLESISNKSRLSLKIIKDIEAGNLENFPPGYDRIFLKRYLKEIGEDRQEVWKEFNLFFGSGPLVEYKSGRGEKTESELKEEKPAEAEQPLAEAEAKPSFLQEVSLRVNLDKVHRYFWISITVIILVVVGYFTWQQFIFVKSNQTPIRQVTVSDFIEQMQAKDSLTTPTIDQASAAQSGSSRSFSVELRAQERTWIREIKDQADTTDYIMPAGLTRKIFADQSIQFMLGRADGVEIFLNGKSLGIMGSTGEIVPRLILNRNGIVEKQLRKTRSTQSESSDTLSTGINNNFRPNLTNQG